MKRWLPLLAFCLCANAQDWPQFGGPHRNFVADTAAIAPWPATGPREIWSRDLGDGFSGISVYHGALYTMYRKGAQEVVIAMDAASGKTLWEYAYDAPFSKEYDMTNGPGPHATPLVSEERVFTAGSTSIFNALDRHTGKLLWRHDLINEFHGTLRVNGYACSPLAYRDTVVMMVGGEGHAAVAFRQADGQVAWQSQSFQNSPSSPVLIRVNGQEQLAMFSFRDIAALDPSNGKLLWSVRHETDFGLNAAMPLLADDGSLFLSSAYGGGSQSLRLSASGAEEAWTSRRLRIHFTNAMRIGDRIYGSSGDLSGGIFTALDAKTGKVAWQDRSIGRANMLRTGDQLLLLDEDGVLTLAKPGATALDVQARAQVLDSVAWTAPSLVGSTLYMRDRKRARAFDLR